MRGLSAAATVIFVIGCGLSESSFIPRSPNANGQDDFANRVAPFLDRDLRKLNKSSRTQFDALLTDVLPVNLCLSNSLLIEPFYIWRSKEDGKTARFVLFRGQSGGSIPGQSLGTIDVFDETGRHTFSSMFATGWRLFVKSASSKLDRTLDTDIFELKTINFFGTDIARQFYCLLDDRVILLGLEDSNGLPVPNNYETTNRTIGPVVPTRTADEWEQALHSEKVPIVLEALMWVGGIHRVDLAPSRDHFLESIESAKLHAAVNASPGVRRSIQELTESENLWINRAAKSALEQKKE